MEAELTLSSSSSENSPATSPLVWSLEIQDENGFGDAAVEDRAALLFAPIVDTDGDSDFGREQGLNSHHGSSSPSVGKELVAIMAKQLVFALAVEKIGPRLGSILYHYQCNGVGGLSERPPPYSFDDAGNLMLDEHLNHPHGSSSVPVHTLMWMSKRLPILLILVTSYLLSSQRHRLDVTLRSVSLTIGCCRYRVSLLPRRILETCAAVSGILTAYGISEGLTRMLKGTVGRRRPNFYALCHFDTETLQCMAPPNQICQAQYSFPSGHASMSACTMIFLCLYLTGRMPRNGGCYGYGRWLASCTLLLSWAVYVSWTRIHEHWHNPSDVVAGFLLGTGSALTAYHLFYPPLLGWWFSGPQQQQQQQFGIPKSVWFLAASWQSPIEDDDYDDVKRTIQKHATEETLPMYDNDVNACA